MSTDTDRQKRDSLSPRHFGRRFVTLLRGLPGPIGLIWMVATLLSLTIWTFLMGQFDPSWLSNGVPNLPLIVVALFVLWCLNALQHALYHPMRKMALDGEGASDLTTVLIDSLSRIPSVMKAQAAVTALTIFIAFLAAYLVSELVIIPIYIATFVLGPVVYFVASREMPVIKAISTSISVARRHVLYILGVPALFVCLGPLVETPSAQQLATTIAASDALLLWKAVTIYILYRYARWLTISAAYVAVDEVESRG